jgi:hypothetical protein
MIPYLPLPTTTESVKFFHPINLKPVAAAAACVLTVIHEQHPMTELLSDHPSVKMWRDYAPFLAHYGLEIIDRANAEGIEWKELEGFNRTLERQLDLATTAEYTLGAPHFMGRKALHDSHLSHFVTNWPFWYPEYLGKVPFGLKPYFA